MSAPVETQVLECIIAADAIAADSEVIVGVSDIAGYVQAVEYVPNAAKSGANSNTRTLTVQNRGTAGAGTLAPATFAMTSGNDLAQYVPKAMTLGSTANVAVAAGDVFTFNSVHASSGLTQPGGLLRIHITPLANAAHSGLDRS